MEKMNSSRDFIVDDIILDTIYKKDGKFTLEQIEKEINEIFIENNIDTTYDTLVSNALLRFVMSGRFEIIKNYFVCGNKNVFLDSVYRDELIDMKNNIAIKISKNNRKLVKNFNNFKKSIKNNVML